MIGGGNFFQGFGQGIAVGAFNHALHNAGNTLFESDPCLSCPPGISFEDLSPSLQMAVTAGGKLVTDGGHIVGVRFKGGEVIPVEKGGGLKQLGNYFSFATPSARAIGYGIAFFRSKILGYKSVLFGRFNRQHLPDGVQGALNKGSLRTGWGWNGNAGRHTFRTGIGNTGRHIDWFDGPYQK